jgi:ADP-dependent NAD(P)H-hydrate dehydratase / NAD(P)H-hydrate epimerase
MSPSGAGDLQPPVPRRGTGGFACAELPLLTAAEMQAWDRRATEDGGIPERVLMEAAGRALASVVHRLYPRGPVLGVVGRGKNGGDTAIALRTLSSWGREVAAVAVPDRPPDEALLHGWSVPYIPTDEVALAFARAAVVLDGLLGTGARGAPREPQARLIVEMNTAGRPIVAVDGPSGVDLTTGHCEGECVQAEVTVTFGAPKRGLLLYPGRRQAGRIVVVEVGFPPLRARTASAGIITPGWAQACLPSVPPDAHKGTLGTVVVVAGESGVAGAAALVGTGAARAGAGKVYLVSTAENRQILQALLPEALFHERDSSGISELLDGADSVVIGPGIGTDDTAARLLERVLVTGAAPLLLDADALTLIARNESLRPGPERPVLFTPHPGELSRLIERTVKEITRDPFAALHEALARYGHTFLLKGSPSTVGETGRPVLVNVSGHSGIATGGMGDLLAGVAAAFLGAGCAPYVAAALALHFSGRAAEVAGRGRGLLPRDVADALPDALLERDPPAPDLPGVLAELPAPH